MTILVANLPAERDRRVIRECLSLGTARVRGDGHCAQGEPGLTTLPGNRGPRMMPYKVLWLFVCIAFRLMGGIVVGRAHAEEVASLRGRTGWKMVIAGDGEELGNLKELVAQRNLADLVEFPGWLGPQGVDELLSRATCAIQPDLATPMNQLSTMAKTEEYLGRGVPVVAVDLLETRRTAEQAAIYVPTGDPAEFAARFIEAWQRLLKAPSIPAQRKASPSRKRARL